MAYDLYEIADMLGMELTAERAGKNIRGKVKNTVKFGNTPIDFTLKMVSSLTAQDGIITLCKGPGAMVVLSAAGPTAGPGIAAILDASKMEAPDELLETSKVKSVAEALKLLAPAIVVTFHRKGRDGWSKQDAARTAIGGVDGG